MPKTKYNAKNFGVVHVFQIPSDLVRHLEIPPVYFKACHYGHVDIVKFEYYASILPVTDEVAEVWVHEIMKIMHVLDDPCNQPGPIDDEDDYYDLDRKFNELYMSDPWAYIDDEMAKLGVESGTAPDSPAPSTDEPPAPNPNASTGENGPGNAAETPATDGRPEDEDNEAREELEKAREKARMLGAGDEQLFIDPRSDWIRAPRHRRHSDRAGSLDVVIRDFSWYEMPGRNVPTSKDYFERAGEGAVAIRHSLAFSRRKSHAADGAVMVDFKWVSVPVLVMGPPLPAAADQATLRHVWTKNLIRQSAAQRTRPVAGLGRLSETEKALLDKQPELLKAMPRRYVQITRMARALSQQLLESDRMSESATRSLAFDIATDLRLAIERRMPNG